MFDAPSVTATEIIDGQLEQPVGFLTVHREPPAVAPPRLTWWRRFAVCLRRFR